MSRSSHASCFVDWCANRSRSSSGVRYYRVPKDNRMEAFLRFARRPELMILPREKIHNYRICSAHFKDGDFMDLARTRLTWSAVPSMEAPAEEAEFPLGKSIPSQNYVNIIEAALAVPAPYRSPTLRKALQGYAEFTQQVFPRNGGLIGDLYNTFQATLAVPAPCRSPTLNQGRRGYAEVLRVTVLPRDVALASNIIWQGAISKERHLPRLVRLVLSGCTFPGPGKQRRQSSGPQEISHVGGLTCEPTEHTFTLLVVADKCSREDPQTHLVVTILVA
ncbi:hypothetical protein HPB52_023158 [Rhipicephalus sanguineus]|uniref:THAP-type domain-containing protein n=1 Tax=Rhipicephalus sanguineus TaxID=34632 RepID=A0A9D4PY11_RHISA|nr:hypothetical protein HPB52_023158 [Rhipicephalus sanguineus]